MLFCSERSSSSSPGPTATFLGAFPNEYKAGSVNAETLNHWLGVCGPSFGFAVTLGRCAGPAPMLAWSLARFTVKGAPDWAVKLPPACHCPKSACTHLLAF